MWRWIRFFGKSGTQLGNIGCYYFSFLHSLWAENEREYEKKKSQNKTNKNMKHSILWYPQLIGNFLEVLQIFVFWLRGYMTLWRRYCNIAMNYFPDPKLTAHLQRCDNSVCCNWKISYWSDKVRLLFSSLNDMYGSYKIFFRIKKKKWDSLKYPVKTTADPG